MMMLDHGGVEVTTSAGTAKAGEEITAKPGEKIEITGCGKAPVIVSGDDGDDVIDTDDKGNGTFTIPPGWSGDIAVGNSGGSVTVVITAGEAARGNK